jgi:hypothetical protein
LGRVMPFLMRIGFMAESGLGSTTPSRALPAGSGAPWHRASPHEPERLPAQQGEFLDEGRVVDQPSLTKQAKRNLTRNQKVRISGGTRHARFFCPSCLAAFSELELETLRTKSSRELLTFTPA